MTDKTNQEKQKDVSITPERAPTIIEELEELVEDSKTDPEINAQSAEYAFEFLKKMFGEVEMDDDDDNDDGDDDSYTWREEEPS